MAIPVLMPKQGITVESCILTKWNVKVGDVVKKGDVLFSYETDKSAFDQEAEVDGEVLALFCEEGDEVPVLTNVCVIGNKGENISSFAPGGATVQAEEVKAEVKPQEAPAPKAKGEKPATSEGVMMPKQGITVESCILTKWNVKVGDAVKKGDVLFSYETDKSSFEQESEFEGEVLVNGLDVKKDALAVKKMIGYLPELNPLYPEMYVREYLEFIARTYRINKPIAEAVNDVIVRTGLTKEQNKKIHMLSKGYRQRVGLASVLIHDPQVLILDEPTTGLDPNQLLEIRDLIGEVGKTRTVLLSTHIMQEVEAICDKVIIINNGRIVANDTAENIKQNKSLEEAFHELTQVPIQ